MCFKKDMGFKDVWVFGDCVGESVLIEDDLSVGVQSSSENARGNCCYE